MSLRLATWNVNSLRARLPRVTEWLASVGPDVCCLQETKMADHQFPAEVFTEMGYASAHHGTGRWNGVAVLSRVGLEDVAAGFGEGVEDPYEGDARLLAATCAGVRVASVYVPNGREVESEFYERKLAWLDELAGWAARQSVGGPDAAPLALLGDFNVAPEDRDVWDVAAFEGATHVTAAERAALGALGDQGFVDALRAVKGEDGLYTFWDYRGGDFHMGRGMRIDHVFLAPALAGRLRDAGVDRDARKGPKPSDHAPVLVELAAEAG